MHRLVFKSWYIHLFTLKDVILVIRLFDKRKKKRFLICTFINDFYENLIKNSQTYFELVCYKLRVILTLCNLDIYVRDFSKNNFSYFRDIF
jgi:hypothetical protein